MSEVANCESEVASSDHIPEIPQKAHQPFLKFPKGTFGKQQRAFCSSWYAKFPWLHYQEGQDNVSLPCLRSASLSCKMMPLSKMVF